MLIQGRLLLDPASRPAPGWLRVEKGAISELGEGALPATARPDAGGPNAIITPAFIDAHLHIPQFGAEGCDGLPLLEWLKRVVFPAEAWFGSGAAREVTRRALRSLLTEGTLGFAGYLTSHAEASREAMTVIERAGVRAVVGRVQMDRGAPASLTSEDRERAAMSPTPTPWLSPSNERGSRVAASLNPRFAIACSEELLAECGWHAKERPDLFVQTHLAESRAELEAVRELFPEDAAYTEVYDRFGLLGPRTLLAHGVHLSATEWDLIRQRDAVVVHCPTANTFLGSGLFDLTAARAHGVRVALGSDVAGGPDHAIPRVARAMIEVAKARSFTASNPADVFIPTPAEAWRQMTRGNALALGWQDAGELRVGSAADLLILRVPDDWHDEHLLGRILYRWSSDLITDRVLGGVRVDPTTI
ncbi:MAG: amidohydrolase family protein [Phycisphaerales bacterium]